MRRSLFSLLFIVVFLFSVTYTVIQPFLSLNAIQIAVHDRDTALLEEYVDFGAVRASLKIQVREQLEARLKAKLGNGPMAQWGLAVVAGLVDQAVEKLMTPEGLAALLRGETNLKSLAESGTDQSAPAWHVVTSAREVAGLPAETAKPEVAVTAAPQAQHSDSPQGPEPVFKGAQYRLLDASHFEVALPGTQQEPVRVILSREGLSWRVTDIRLPVLLATP